MQWKALLRYKLRLNANGKLYYDTNFTIQTIITEA